MIEEIFFGYNKNYKQNNDLILTKLIAILSSQLFLSVQHNRYIYLSDLKTVSTLIPTGLGNDLIISGITSKVFGLPKSFETFL